MIAKFAERALWIIKFAIDKAR